MPGAFTNHSAQQVIDAEIKRLLANVQELRFLRNSHSAIHKLPIDIISLILLESKRTDFYSRKQTWKGLLGVCRRWRDILLALPAFWSMVDIPNECCPLQEVIQRSRRHPLSVVALLGEDTEISLQPILAESERFKELSITLHPMCPDDALSSITISTSTPILQTLTLKAPTEHTFLAPTFPSFISCESLTVLRIEDIGFRQDFPVFPSLRKLIVVGDWEDDDLSNTCVGQILRNTPRIEEVHIQGVSDTWDATLDDDLPVTLPSLKYLSIVAKYVSEGDIFDVLRFPSSAIVVALYSGPFDGFFPPHLRFETVLSRFTSGSDAVSYEKMRIIEADDKENQTSFHIELFSSDFQRPEPFLSHGVPFDCDVSFIYPELCTSVSLFQITELVLSQFCPSQEWRALFSALVNLEVLSLEDLGDSWLTHLLADATMVFWALKFSFEKVAS